MDMLTTTIIVVAVAGLFLQAVRFLLAAIIQPTDE
jgi:hypothetical protein